MDRISAQHTSDSREDQKGVRYSLIYQWWAGASMVRYAWFGEQYF